MSHAQSAVETGRFATSRRGLDIDEMHYARRQFDANVPSAHIARQLGRSVDDVRIALARVPSPPAEKKPPRDVVMLSLWRGLIVVSPERPRRLRPWETIVQRVADKHGITFADIIGQDRSRRFAWPRQEAMWLLVQDGRWSTTQIGKFIGGRDHSTVFHACAAHEKRMAEGVAA